MKPKPSTRNALIQGIIVLLSFGVLLFPLGASIAWPTAIIIAVTTFLANVGPNLFANAIQEILPARRSRIAPNRPAFRSVKARLWLIRRVRHSDLLALQLGERINKDKRADRIDLGLRTAPWAVHHRYYVPRHHLPGLAEDLPAGTSIREVFERTEGGLLILGEPGSGKTTLMLELAREGLNRAEHDTTAPIPVVFVAASWARRPTRRDNSLDAWLVAELCKEYRMKQEEARSWIESERLLVMLDGLDEVASAQRPAFFEALRKYRQDYAKAGLVVCSRTAEYRSLIEAPPSQAKDGKSNAYQVSYQMRKAQRSKRPASEPLPLEHAITVQRLVLTQVTSYLEKWGPAPLVVWKAIEAHSRRHDLLYTPLILNVLAATYHDKSLAQIEKVGMPRTIRQLWDAYVEKMLDPNINAAKTSFIPVQQMRYWLGWLARQMRNHNQTVFYIEHLQPDWLPAPTRWLDKARVKLVVGLGGGPIAAWAIGIAVTLVVGLIAGTLLALGTGHIERVWQSFLFGAFLGLMFAMYVGGFSHEPEDVSYSIKPTEVVVPSLRGLWQGIYGYMIIGLRIAGVLVVMGVGGLLIGSYPDVELLPGLGNLLLFSLMAAVMIGGFLWLLGAGFVHGLSAHVLADERRERPNQGIWQSGRNGLIYAVVGGSGPGILFWVFDTLPAGRDKQIEPSSTLLLVLCAGLFAGILFGLGHGWAACIQHLTLRLLLWRTGVLPLNLVRFLNYGTARIMLRRVGGGYMFIHQLLLEYFAASGTPGLSTYPTARKWKIHKVRRRKILG